MAGMYLIGLQYNIQAYSRHVFSHIPESDVASRHVMYCKLPMYSKKAAERSIKDVAGVFP